MTNDNGLVEIKLNTRSEDRITTTNPIPIYHKPLSAYYLLNGTSTTSKSLTTLVFGNIVWACFSKSYAILPV